MIDKRDIQYPVQDKNVPSPRTLSSVKILKAESTHNIYEGAKQ